MPSFIAAAFTSRRRFFLAVGFVAVARSASLNYSNAARRFILSHTIERGKKQFTNKHAIVFI